MEDAPKHLLERKLEVCLPMQVQGPLPVPQQADGDGLFQSGSDFSSDSQVL